MQVPSPRLTHHVRPWMPPRVPAFYAVPVRARADGWTPLKQAEFIGHLAELRCAEAARWVGMTRETAYRLRRRKWAASFIAAWDIALGREGPGAPAEGHSLPQRKVTDEELAWRVKSGLWKAILRNNRFAGVARKSSNSDTLKLVRRMSRGGGGLHC